MKCKTCDKPTKKNKPYCNRGCQDKWERRQNVWVCEVCGKQWTGLKRRFCSTKCRVKTYNKRYDCTCLNCNKTFTNHLRKKKYCSWECCAAHFAAPLGVRMCTECGEDFTYTRNMPNKTLCSKTCKAKVSARNRIERLMPVDHIRT